MNGPKLSIGQVNGDRQITLYYVDKPTLADLNILASEHFPDKKPEELRVLPGYGFLVLTEGSDFDVPKS